MFCSPNADCGNALTANERNARGDPGHCRSTARPRPRPARGVLVSCRKFAWLAAKKDRCGCGGHVVAWNQLVACRRTSIISSPVGNFAGTVSRNCLRGRMEDARKPAEPRGNGRGTLGGNRVASGILRGARAHSPDTKTQHGCSKESTAGRWLMSGRAFFSNFLL